MRKTRFLSLRAIFALVLVAAVLIKIWPSLVVLTDAAIVQYTERVERGELNEKLKKLADEKGMEVLPDDVNQTVVRVASR